MLGGLLTMSAKEIDRLGVVRRVIEGRMRLKTAADLPGVSTRQMRRICDAYERGRVARAGDGRSSYQRLSERANHRGDGDACAARGLRDRLIHERGHVARRNRDFGVLVWNRMARGNTKTMARLPGVAARASLGRRAYWQPPETWQPRVSDVVQAPAVRATGPTIFVVPSVMVS